ncbi:GNAT family N-acetyltransferase [Microvirga arsenatis]|uniref:GNAT family N-acetyltransferase n=1 Tax=Microvirga arsenatis TaxID=2692265 RepID=A0ABW9YU98_9HYPH|nr:GNAT family N-acetyltransferase [Microvirga arsenatis]NBJ09548.1 GNAT family N-acetyltransferase [Microvirga arsenatis]NBJ23593.1 GNAT family N-acetyltransferase [Microvirga arsenatis]
MARFDLSIRKAVIDDAETIFSFVAGLIDDHLPGQTPWTSAERIKADGFGPDPLFEAFMAERNAQPVGFVSFFRGYAGWRGKPMGIAHALYVLPQERRTGAARALMASVAKTALERGWIRVELFVEEERPAIRFYEAVGLRDLHHRHMRLEGDALQRLASEA